MSISMFFGGFGVDFDVFLVDLASISLVFGGFGVDFVGF